MIWVMLFVFNSGWASAPLAFDTKLQCMEAREAVQLYLNDGYAICVRARDPNKGKKP